MMGNSRNLAANNIKCCYIVVGPFGGFSWISVVWSREELVEEESGSIRWI